LRRKNSFNRSDYLIPNRQTADLERGKDARKKSMEGVGIRFRMFLKNNLMRLIPLVTQMMAATVSISEIQTPAIKKFLGKLAKSELF
jgi:hypothetical protein